MDNLDIEYIEKKMGPDMANAIRATDNVWSWRLEYQYGFDVVCSRKVKDIKYHARISLWPSPPLGNIEKTTLYYEVKSPTRAMKQIFHVTAGVKLPSEEELNLYLLAYLGK